MNEINALDFLVDTAFIVGSNLDFKLNAGSDILKANNECILILQEKLKLNDEEILIDDGFKFIFDSIVTDSQGPVILGLLNSIFRTSYRGPDTPISSLVWKEQESVRAYERSLYCTPKNEVLKIINEVIQMSKKPPFIVEQISKPQESNMMNIDLSEMIANSMAAAAAGGSK